MFAQNPIDAASAAIASVYTLVEEDFLAAGERLASAIEALVSLTDCVKGVIAVLDSADIRDAAAALSRASVELGLLSGTIAAEAAPLERLAGATETISVGAQRMRSVVREVSALSVNARLAAVAIQSDEGGLLSFSTEIRHSASLAQGNLTRFTDALGAVMRQLHAALAQHRSFEARYHEAMQTIPDRLARNLTAIQTSGQHSRAVAAGIDGRSRTVRERVAVAVSSLQFGDITRQRIEHAQLALDKLSAITRQDSAAMTGRKLSGLAGLVCRVASAQLLDMAEEFEHESQRILAALRALAPEAEDIGRAGRAASSASGDGQDTFLVALEADVRDTLALLSELEAARGATALLVTSVIDNIGALNGHLRMVRAAEAEIHIMGLNTTLKCGRLGTAGRPMSVIAQELRSCGGRTAAQVDDVRNNLQKMTRIATDLSAQRAQAKQEAEAKSGSDTASVMAAAVERLAAAGQLAAAALEPLAPTSARVARLLEEAISGFAAHQRICAVLRQSGDELAMLVEPALPSGRLNEDDACLDQIAACYTMQRERDVHNRACGGAHVIETKNAVTVQAGSVAELQGVDDMLF